MFTVAPKGSTNPAVRRLTPARRSRQSMVTGSVAAEELVENAIRSAGIIA